LMTPLYDLLWMMILFFFSFIRVSSSDVVCCMQEIDLEGCFLGMSYIGRIWVDELGMEEGVSCRDWEGEKRRWSWSWGVPVKFEQL
jgi:hypothetical protein